MASAVIVLLCMTVWCCAGGSTVRWTAPAGDSWSQQDNWEGRKVPAPDDDVVIELDEVEEGYRSLGCWRDSSNRVIPILEGEDPRLDGHYQARVNATEKCFQVARSRGFSVFAVQNGGQCFGSVNGHNTYTRYGTSSACGQDGEGGYYANAVYQIKAFPITVRVDSDTEIRNLHTFPNITLEVVNSLTVKGIMQVDGHLTLFTSDSNKGIEVGNVAQVKGSFVWMAGKFSSRARGQLHVEERMQLNPGWGNRHLDARLSGTELYIHGEALVEGSSSSGRLYISNGAKLIVTEGATLNMTGILSLLKENTGSIVNNGSLNIQSSGTVSVAPTIYSIGDVQVLKGVFSCTGSSTWQNGIWVSSGATLKLSGGTHTLQQSSTLLGSGNLDVGARVTVLSKDVQVINIRVSGGTLDLYTASSELTVAKIEVASRGVFNIHSSGNSSDWLPLHVPEVILRSNNYDYETATLYCERNLRTKRLHMSPGRYQTGLLFKVMGDVAIAESWTWNGGTVQASGPVTVNGSLLIEGSTDGTTRVPEMYLNGPVTTRGSQTININHGGKIFNSAGNVVSIRGSLNLRGSGYFQNNGEVRVEQSSPGTASIALSSFDNFGRTTVSGTPGSGLSISINHGLTGTYHVSENNVLTIVGSSTHVGRILKYAVLTGGGSLQVNGPEVGFKSIQVSDVSVTAGTVYIGSEQRQSIPSLKVTRGLVVLDESSSATEIDDLVITGGEVTFNRPTTIHDVEVRSGVLSGDSDINVNGTFVWTGGTLACRLGSRINVNGNMQVAPSGTLNLNRYLVLKGKSDWVTTSLNLVLTRVFEISSGASLSIHGGGMIFTSSSSDENGALQNYGDIIIDAPYQDLRINTPFRNYASIQIKHGNLFLQRSSVMAGAMINSTDKSKIVISDGNHEIVTDGTLGIQEWQPTLEVTNGNVWSKNIVWSTIDLRRGNVHLDLSGSSASMDSISVTGGSLQITSTTPSSDTPTLTVHNSVTVTNGQLKLLGVNCNVKHLTISHQNARIEIERHIEIKDTFLWDAGTLAGTAFADCEISRTSVPGTLTVTGNGVRYLRTQSMSIQGNGQWFGQGQLRLDSAAELIIAEGASFEDQGGGTYTSQDNLARVVNKGTYKLFSHSDVNMDVKFQNTGQLYLPDTATLSFRADAQLRGQLQADKGSELHLLEGSHLIIDEASTFRGKLSSMSTSVVFYSNGSLEDIQVGAGQTTLNTQLLSMNVSKLSVNGGHLTVEPSRLSNNPTELFVENAEIVSGTLELNVQTVVGYLSQTGGSVRGSFDIIAEEFEWSSGNVIGDLGSKLSVKHLKCLGTGTKTLKQRSLTLQQSGRFVGDAAGVIDINGHGNFVITKEANLMITAGVTIDSDLGMFENKGMLINALQSNGKVLTVNGHFRNTGIVKCLDDTLMKVSGTGKWEGALTTGSNATVEIAEGHHLFLSSFEVNGTGKLVVSSGSVTMHACSVSAAVMQISAPVYIHGENRCFIQSLLVTENGVLITNSPTSVGQVHQNGGVVHALSSLTVAEYDLVRGTLQSHNVIEVDQLQWSSGTITGGKLYAGTLMLTQGTEKIASQVTVVVLKSCVWAEEFDQTLGLRGNSALIISQRASMDVNGIAALSSETSDSYRGRLENHGQINVKQSFTSSAEFINFGNLSVSEGTMVVTKKSENRGYIKIGQNSEVKLRDYFSYPSSVIEGDGKLTLTQGTIRLSTDTLKQNTIHVTGAIVSIVLASGHAFSPKEVKITGGQVDLLGNKDNNVELESLTIAGGTVKIHRPCNISKLAMTGGSLNIMAPTDITEFDFFAGQLVGVSDLGSLTVDMLMLHNYKSKDGTRKILQAIVMEIRQQFRWLTPINKDTVGMQDGSVIRLMPGCETTLQGQLEFQGNSETIENNGDFLVYGSDENLPHRTTSISIGPHFNNAGTVWVQESSMVSFQSTARISGSMVAHSNANVEFVNHYSTTPQNITGGRLAVRNSNLWILSNNFTTLNINSGGHVKFVNTAGPGYNSFVEEVSLNRGSVNFDSDVSIGVFKVTGGTVKSTSPNGVIRAQQLTFHEDTESSTVEDCNVSGREIHFIGSNVALMTSSVQIQHNGIARSFVQLDMLNSSVLVEEGATLAIKHKMAVRKTGVEESSILDVTGTVHVEGPQFVSSAAVVLQTTGKFTVTKDSSELDIHITGRSSGTFNINCTDPTITIRGPGDLVLDKGSFIGPNAMINVHGGHAVITTGIEHQLLEGSGLKMTLQGTGSMTLNSSQFSETSNPLTVNEVLLKSLPSNLYLSDAIPKVQKMIITGGQVHGSAEFDTVILQSNLQLTDCSFDIDHLIIRGGNNDDKEIQASQISILRSLRVETDATITLSQASVLRLASSATFTMENALEITASDVGSEASWFLNEGRITVSLGAGRIASIGAKFNHSGELSIEDGHLTMSNDSFIQGSLQVGTSSRLTLSAGVHRIQRGSSCLVQGKLLVESAAFVEVDSDDMSIESVTSHGSVTLRGETCISGLELSEGNFEVGGNAGFGALDMKTGTLSVKGDMTVNGPVKWQSGTIHLSAGSSLTVNGDFIQAISDGELENQGGTFTISPANSCGVHTDCTSCQGGGDCSWYPTANLCVQNTIAGPSTCSARHCRQKLACSNFGTTEACSSQQNCTWCLATDMCVQHEQCPSAAAFWTNSAGGEWHAASNWFNDTIPGEGSDAFLTSLSEDYEVRITNAISLQALEIGSQCDHTFSQGCDTMQTLTVQRDLQVDRLLVRRNARLIIGGGDLVIGSSLTVEGRMDWTQGTIRGDGRINIMGQLTIHQDCYYCHKSLQVPLESYGRITLQTTSNSLTMSPQVNITNAGEILIKSNGVINGGTIYNEGLIYSTTPTANINSNMVQSGHLVLQQSRLQLGGDAEFSGPNNFDQDSELVLKSGTHVFSFGSTVPSSLTLEGGTTTINTTGNTIRSLHLKNSATVRSDKELQVENVYLERGTLLGNGDYQINTFRWWEGNIEGMKRILVTKEMSFLDDRYYYYQRKTMAESTISLQGRALVQGSQATLTMSRNASFEVTSSGEIHVPLSTTLSLRCSDGACRTTNSGYLDVIGSLVISTDLASRGSVAVDGRVDLSGNSKFESGKIWVGSSGTLHLAGNQKDVSIGALVGVNIYGTLSVSVGVVVVSSQKIAYIKNIHCSGGRVRFTNTTNLKTIGTVYVRNSQITLQTGDATGLNVGKIEGRYSGNVILASPTTVSVIVLQENSSPGATIRLDSPKHAYKVLDSVTLNDGQHQIVGTVDDGGTKPTLYIVGEMNLQHYYQHFYFQNVDVSISGTLSHICRDNRNYGVYLADGSTLTVEESGQAAVGGCNWLHSGSLPTSFTNNGVLRFHDDPTSIHTTFVQNGTMYTTTNTNLHLYGQSILQGNVTIGKNAAVNFRGGSQHHILSDAMHEYSSTLNLLDDNTILNVSTDDLRLSKVKVDSHRGRLLLFSRSDAGSVNLLELRRGSIQIGFSQLTTDEIFLTTGEISGNDARVWTRKITLHDTYRDSFVRVGNLTVTEKLLISKSYPSYTRQVTIDSFVTILHSATLVAVTRFTIYGEGEIRNEGTFLIDSTDDQWLDIRVRFVNYGHLQVTNRLVLNNGGSSHGKIHMMPTAKLYFRSSKIYNLTNAGEIVGSGTFYLDSGDPVVYLGGKYDSMENPGKDIGLVVTRGKCYVDFTQARKLVQRMSISGGSVEITASTSDPPYITEVNFLADWNYNVLFTCNIGTSVSIGKLTLRQYRTTGHFGHGCGVVASNMVWYSGIINIPAYFHVSGHLDIKQDRGYKRIIATNMSITATAVADADSTILMSDGSKIDINGSFSMYNNLRFQKEGSGTPQLVIGGQLRLLQRDRTMTVTPGISVINNGNIEVLHGTLSIPSTECNSGTFVVAKDALIHFNSGLTQLGIDCSIDISGVSIAGNSRLEILENGNIWQHITITSGTLALNPNSNITVETLNLNGNVQISGQFRVRKFNLNYQGNMEVTGLVIITEEMVWSGGSLMSNQVQVDGNLYLTSTSTKYLRSGTIVATGTVTSTNPQTLVMQGDARFELQGSMAVHESLRFSGTGQNSFLNAGLINVQAGLNQYGLIVDVNFDSPGVVVVESGKMTVGYSNRDVMSTVHGNLTIKEQAILEMGYGEFTVTNRSILNVDGTISIASAQVKVYSAHRSVRISNIKMTSSGTLETTAKDVSIHTAEICSGTLWIHRSAKIETLQICGGRLRPGRSVNVTEFLITSGDVFSSGARPKIVARRMGWGAGRVWANDGTTAITIQVDERLHVFGTSSKYEEYDTVIRVNGRFTMISGGNLYMSRGAIIQLNTDSTVSMHHGYMRTQYNPPGRLTNMGDLTIGEYSKATTVDIAVQFQMLGKLSIKQGRIRIASGGRLSGSTELFNDGRVEVTGGTLTATGASISGPGDLYVSGGILSLDGGEVYSPISITSGTLQVSTDNRVTTRGAVRIHGGTLNVDGYLECLQDARYISGLLSGTGIVRLGNQSKILVMSTQSSDRRTTSVRSLQIFGLLQVSSSLEVRSPGVVRNEEEGRVQMTRSGAITGTGRVENYGRLSAGDMHPDIAARISSKFENFWVVEPDNSSLILEPYSSTATHKISSRVLGGVTTWRNGVTLGGVTEGSVVIQGNCYVGQATVFNGNITWESGTISLQEDQCSTRWYDSSKIMRSDCSEKYVLNTGDIILETSSDKTLSTGVDLVNKGNIKWFSGKMIVGGNVKNLAGGKFEITDESNTDHSWQNSGNTLDNNGVLLVKNARCLFQDRYGNRRGSLHNKGSLFLREESFLQIDTLTSGGDHANFEMAMDSVVTASQIIVESGTAYLQGQINSRVHVSGGKLNVGGLNTMGSLSIEGSLFMSNTSVLEVDLVSPLPSVVSDTLTVSSDIELHGKLAVSWNSDRPTPNNMDSFPIIAYGGNCRIDGLVTVALDDNVNFNTTCGDSFLTVTVIR